MTSSKKVSFVDVVFDTDEPFYFSGKKVNVEYGTGFVNFIGLIKVVCKHDQNNLNSERLWKRLLPEISKNDWKLVNKCTYISPSAVNKLVEQNQATCKKTWGVFYDDGYNQFTRNLKKCKYEKYSVSTIQKKRSPTSPSATEPESSKKVRMLAVPEDDNKITEENVKEFLEIREYVLNEREKSIQEREELISSREKILTSKELLMIQRETEYTENQKKLEKEQARLEKKKTEMGDPGMSAFFEQISSLTNKFKAKHQASRVNSSEDEDDNKSLTPEVSTEKLVGGNTLPLDKSKKKDSRNNSPTPSRTPSPIPIESPVRTVTPTQKK